MSGSKSISGFLLSDSVVIDGVPAGTEVGTITVDMGDGNPFTGTLTSGGQYASSFRVTATPDPVTIISVQLSALTVAGNAPVGTTVATITVTMSDHSTFAGTLSVNDTTRFAISGNTLKTAAALAAGNYPVTITAKDNAGRTLAANFQIVAQQTVTPIGPLTNIKSPSQTTTSITVGWSAPTSGTRDNGVHQIQYKDSAATTWTNAAAVPYCTPSHGSIKDAFGNVWSINPTGQVQTNAVMCNGAYANGYNSPLAYLVGSSIYHQGTGGTWYSFRPTGTVSASSVSWTTAGATAPITSPGLTISGLTVNKTINVRGYATNSAGRGTVSAAIDVKTTTNPPQPGPVQPPAAAVAAGYTTLAFFSGFDSASEVTADRSGNTAAKWYAKSSNLKYTIANSILSLNSSVSSYNDCISTVANGSAPLTTPGAIRAGNGNGLRFKYGCFECMQKFDPSRLTGQGWIAWWASGFQGNVLGDSSKNSIELDFFECFQGNGIGGSSTGLWNWASSPVTTVPTFATSGWGDVTYLVNQSTANTAIGQATDWFVAGGVVTPTKVEVYFNSKARRAQGIADTTIFRVDTTRTYSVTAGGQKVNAVFDASRLCDMQLLLGGSDGSPYEIEYAAAWQ